MTVAFFQRLIERWWSFWAVAGGIGLTRLTPPPPPQVDPWLSAGEVAAQAERAAVADAASAMFNQWSFGGPGDPPSEVFDPPFVRELRHRRETAIGALRTAHRLTGEQLREARRRRDESQARMDDARARMSGLASREDADELDPVFEPVEGPREGDRTPWEGESTPLRLIWRLLILAVLIAAEAILQYTVFDYFLGTAGRDEVTRWMALLVSAVVVLGPFLSGTLLRSRAATGGERHGWYAFAVLAASWLFVIVVLGLVRGRVLEAGVPATGRLHVTPLTVILMFVALMLVGGSMAFMLGLARRHPFQEAYVRNRAHRDRYELVMRTIAARLNPAYVTPDEGEDPLDVQERAIREAYAAAEEAYFAALARAVGDPAFTEAVQHRRGSQVRS
ncbi:hypothetical protein [Actinoplanes sp. NPDC051851]|uniref:hypothetical protein n=1 Tax=Actinoplanes sp. NPDC051851 TaxID=3154753 RepID=UPI003424B32E